MKWKQFCHDLKQLVLFQTNIPVLNRNDWIYSAFHPVISLCVFQNKSSTNTAGSATVCL